jgi:hypothetical protein
MKTTSKSLSRLKILPTTISEAQMAGGEVRTLVLTVAIITLLAVGLYMVDPTMCGLVKAADGFMDANEATLPATSTGSMAGMPSVDATSMSGAQQVMANGANPNADLTQQASALVNSLQQTMNQGSPASGSPTAGYKNPPKQEGFANLEDITGPAEFGSTPNPNGCYPRDQLTPGELLPKDGNSTWAQQNPMGTGSLKGKNFLSAGALVGVNTVGQSLRNANQQLRSEPPNPQVPVSVFFNSTIEPDTNRRDMEIN